MEKWLLASLESVKSSGGLEAICSSLISQQGFGKSGTFYKRDLKIVLSFIFLSTCDLRAAQKSGEEGEQKRWIKGNGLKLAHRKHLSKVS